MDDYYELLDVAPDAERDDIRTAYRAKRDALTSTEGESNRAEVAKLNRAWNVLSDPAQRDRYDERLAEYRESDEDGDYDEDDDDDDGGERVTRPRRAKQPLTRAEKRAEIRRARLERKPTIEVPEGLTMASTRNRLSALGFDVAVLMLVAGLVYFVGLKLIDNHFPGQQQLGRDLSSEQKKVIKEVNDDRKRASDADDAAAAAKTRKDSAAEQKAKDKAVAARAEEAKDKKRVDALDVRINEINRRLSPWIYTVLGIALLLTLLYLVPSTAINGQTLGKKLRRIRVVRLDGSRPGWSTALVRFGLPVLAGVLLGLLLGAGPFGLAIVLIVMIGWVTNPNRQGIHDRLAKTIVVEA